MKFNPVSPTFPRPEPVAILGNAGRYGDGVFLKGAHSGQIYHLGLHGLNQVVGAKWRLILNRSDVTPIYSGDKYEVEF